MRKIICLFVMVMLLGGCALSASITRDKLATLKPNMSMEQVQGLMGKPFSTETYLSNDNKNNIVWYYRTKYYTDDFGVTHQELTPLVFKDNMLLGWGSNFYDKLIQTNVLKQDVRIKQE